MNNYVLVIPTESLMKGLKVGIVLFCIGVAFYIAIWLGNNLRGIEK